MNDGTTGTNTKYTEQHIANMSYDERMALASRLLMGYDDTPGAEGTRRVAVNPNSQLEVSAPDLAVKVTNVGSITYIGFALPGSAEATAIWQAIKYENGRLYYADGNANYDNVATDLTSLNYL